MAKFLLKDLKVDIEYYFEPEQVFCSCMEKHDKACGGYGRDKQEEPHEITFTIYLPDGRVQKLKTTEYKWLEQEKNDDSAFDG